MINLFENAGDYPKWTDTPGEKKELQSLLANKVLQSFFRTIYDDMRVKQQQAGMVDFSQGQTAVILAQKLQGSALGISHVLQRFQDLANEEPKETEENE